jgi:PhnB protein
MKILGRVLVALIPRAALCPSFPATASDEDSVRDAVARWTDAWNSGDADRFLAFYVRGPKAVYFEGEIAQPIKGFEAFDQYTRTTIVPEWHTRQETTIEALSIDHDLAVAVCVAHVTYTDPERKVPHSEIGRFTMVFKSVDGKWLVWHEHYSLPYDYDTGKVVFDGKEYAQS